MDRRWHSTAGPPPLAFQAREEGVRVETITADMDAHAIDYVGCYGLMNFPVLSLTLIILLSRHLTYLH